jgi:hypothetical protein
MASNGMGERGVLYVVDWDIVVLGEKLTAVKVSCGIEQTY